MIKLVSMYKSSFNFIVIVLTISFSSYSQSIFGKWKTIDDETGKEKSIVEIYQSRDGKAYAKILELLEKDKQDKLCTNCKGKYKNRPIKGLEIINGLIKDDDEWNGAKILDPKTGKEYKCIISLEEPTKLKVRGYIGFALIGRTQYWHKVEN
ncbi:DUF2147 domain-containing protein [Lutibacter sp.]|uniref:DUF2147 domain-containing protein n=1 Tax=Lutibacter sp. TaxID=1925666 RepID=UPI0025BB9411|nr:DUF2147 domain-containing protein [Lutibacter sp.]